LETLNQIFTWLSNHESGFSALAALLVIIGVTLSPFGSGLRRALGRRAQNLQIDKDMAPDADQLSGQHHTNGPRVLSDKPSVAVLPFENLSGDTEQAYFSEGIAEDIIVALSKLHSLFVIARNTSFAYKELEGQGGNLGKALGARYIVQGSVRKVGERARINAQLVDTESDEQLWAERFDRDLDDVFLVQDEITAKVISILPSRIEAADLKRTHNKPTNNLKAYDYLLRGKYHHHLRTRSDNTMAYDLLSQAVEADPSSAQAYAWRACVIGQALFRGYRDDEAATEEILQDLGKALTLDDEDFECHRVFSGVYTIQQNYDRALFHAQRAFELNPNDPRVISQYGELLVLVGDAEAGIDMQKQALQVDPYSPDDRLTHLGFAQFAGRHYQDALDTFKKISSLDVKHHAYLAACHAQLGDSAGAEREATELSKLDAEFSVDEFVTQLQYKNDADSQHHIDALRLAGL